MLCTCFSSQQMCELGGLAPPAASARGRPRVPDGCRHPGIRLHAGCNRARRPPHPGVLDSRRPASHRRSHSSSAGDGTLPARQPALAEMRRCAATGPCRAPLSAQGSLTLTHFTAKPCFHTRVLRMWLHLSNESSRPNCSRVNSVLSPQPGSI
jgi:hypothetical protein